MTTTKTSAKKSSITEIICKKCDSMFNLVPIEMDFYKKKDLPWPNLCPACRMERRIVLRNDRKLYIRKCDKCKKEISSIYSSDSPYTVYCEECFTLYLRKQ